MTETKTREQQAKEYSKIRIKLSIVGMVLTLCILVLTIISGLTYAFRDWAFSLSSVYVMQVFLYFCFFYLLAYLIDIPFEWYSSFYLEHKYALSNLSFKGWLWEDSKKRLLSFLFGALLIIVLYAVIYKSPTKWWLWCWAFWIFFSIIIGKLAPIIIVPLFYKYDEIKDEHIKSKIYTLVADTKLKIKNVYSLNLSKTTKKANAAFMGLGNTKRVVLGDTLISNFTPEEIETVVAHEVGHYKYNHIAKHIVASAIGSLIAFYVAYRVLLVSIDVLPFQGITDVAIFPLLSLIFFLFNVLVMPLQNWFSRVMEREADAYALKRTNRKEDFISTMQKLGDLNLSDPSPHPIVEAIFYSHPSLRKRINWAQSQSMQ